MHQIIPMPFHTDKTLQPQCYSNVFFSWGAAGSECPLEQKEGWRHFVTQTCLQNGCVQGLNPLETNQHTRVNVAITVILRMKKQHSSIETLHGSTGAILRTSLVGAEVVISCYTPCLSRHWRSGRATMAAVRSPARKQICQARAQTAIEHRGGGLSRSPCTLLLVAVQCCT